MLKRLTLVAAALIVALLSPPSALALERARSSAILPSPSTARKKHLDLDEAMRRLNIPSVSLAVIEEGRIAFAKAYGGDATPETLYQAASLSKFVAAIGAMRLVEQGMLDLDQDVNAKLTSWRVPANEFDAEHKVTLRGLLSMTGGIGVPGFIGYEPGAPLPTLTQILDGAPPANSPKVTVIAVPGSGFRYSGGGYEIAEALMQDATGKPFPQPHAGAGARARRHDATAPSTQPLPAALAGGRSERPLRRRARAAGTLARLSGTRRGGALVDADRHRQAARAARPVPGTASARSSCTARRLQEVLTPQNGGPYGLGAAIAGDGASLALMKRGQNIGYQGYLILYPATGQGMVVMTDSDNGSTLAASLIKRAAAAYGWPDLPSRSRTDFRTRPLASVTMPPYIRHRIPPGRGRAREELDVFMVSRWHSCRAFVFLASPLSLESAEKTFQDSSLDDAASSFEAELKDEAGTVEKPVTRPQKGSRGEPEGRAISMAPLDSTRRSSRWRRTTVRPGGGLPISGSPSPNPRRMTALRSPSAISTPRPPPTSPIGGGDAAAEKPTHSSCSPTPMASATIGARH